MPCDAATDEIRIAAAMSISRAIQNLLAYLSLIGLSIADLWTFLVESEDGESLPAMKVKRMDGPPAFGTESFERLWW